MDFQTEVIARSHELPVLVDFWAPWCGPCRVLGPVLEQLAGEQADRWALVKIDTEAEQALAQAYRIQSIPNVKLFHLGEPIAEFAGALPRSAILAWLEEHLPDPRKAQLSDLLAKLKADPSSENRASLDSFVRQHPGMKEGRLALAEHIVFAEPDKAANFLVDILLGDPLYDAADAVRTIAELLNWPPSPECPAAEHLAQAQIATRRRQWRETIESIIAAAAADKQYQKDLPRRAGIAFFRIWGEAHALTKAYRWRFNMALD